MEKISPMENLNPEYYKQGNGRQLIDTMIEIYGEEATAHFCLLNAQKYMARAGKKTTDPTTDIGKAIWYLQAILKIQEQHKTQQL